MKNDNFIDLSDIKENELDKTSSFTDLMSRSQRKAYKKAKMNQSEEKIDSNIINDKIDLNEYKEIFNDTEEKIESKNEENNDIVEYEVIKAPKTINIILTGLFTICCIGYYIYLILFTDTLMRRKFFICESAIISAIILLLCINSVGKKILSKIAIILLYICILAFISFNILIKFNIIK